MKFSTCMMYRLPCNYAVARSIVVHYVHTQFSIILYLTKLSPIVTITVFAVICPDLTIPANGALVYSDTTIPRADGSTATYSCDTGYQVTGLMVRMCSVSGWSTGDDPVCTGEGDECICANVRLGKLPCSHLSDLVLYLYETFTCIHAWSAILV